MEVIVKSFKQLNTKELYDLLQLRSEVFVVEQDCVYQDIDNKDQKALHILGYKNDNLVAYTRCFKPGDYFSEASIGRVVVKKSERKHKLGCAIMKSTLNTILIQYKTKIVELSAQTYLIKFYKNLGFEVMGNEYLEDGIPHIKMVKN